MTRGFYCYYVEAENVTPAEPSPGLYIVVGREPHGPFYSREAAYEAWQELRAERENDESTDGASYV